MTANDPALQGFKGFLCEESGELVRAGRRGTVRTVNAVTLALFFWTAWQALVNPAPGRAANSDPLFYLLLLAFCLYIGLLAGFFVGFFSASRRMASWGAILPLVVLPIGILAGLSIFRGTVYGEAMEFLRAFRFAVEAQGSGAPPQLDAVARIPSTALLELIFSILTIPAWGLEAMPLIMKPAVLMKFGNFLGSVFFAGAAGFVPAAIASGLPLYVVFVWRLKRRFREGEVAAAVKAASPSPRRVPLTRQSAQHQ